MSNATTTPERLKNAVTKKWPEAICSLARRYTLYFPTGFAALDALFPCGRGIPYGQLIEITGRTSSGKTSLLLRLLGANTAGDRSVAYVDFNDTFFPDAALAAGVDAKRLVVIKIPAAQNVSDGLRAAELLLRDRHADIVVFDLVGRHTPLPLGLLHRLRLRAVRARGLVVFLTEGHEPPTPQPDTLIPSSMTSLRLEVQRADINASRLQVTVTKSRLCPEGLQVELEL